MTRKSSSFGGEEAGGFLFPCVFLPTVPRAEGDQNRKKDWDGLKGEGLFLRDRGGFLVLVIFRSRHCRSHHRPEGRLQSMGEWKDPTGSERQAPLLTHAALKIMRQKLLDKCVDLSAEESLIVGARGRRK